MMPNFNEIQSKNWHTREVHAVLDELDTNTMKGLSDADAAARLTRLGSVVGFGPRSPQAGFLSSGIGRQIVWIGALIGLIGLAIAYLFYDPANPDDRSWQTMLFTTLAFLQIGQALASRSSRESFFAQGLRSNPLMMWMVLLTTGLKLIVIYVPVFQEFFRVSPLSITNLGICIIAGSLAFVAIEIDKRLQRFKRSWKWGCYHKDEVMAVT